MSDSDKPGGRRPRTVADALRESRGTGSSTRERDAAPTPADTTGPSTADERAETTRTANVATSRRDADTSTLSPSDYARTTRPSADTTSVMPAITDEPPVRGPVPKDAAVPSAARGRQARLRLQHVEPWSVTRLAFVVSVALMIVAVVAVTIFWVVLDLTGIWDQLNGTITTDLADNEATFDLTDYLGLGRLVGLTLIFSAVNVVLMTILATVAAHLYNLAALLLGGIQVTFGED